MAVTERIDAALSSTDPEDVIDAIGNEDTVVISGFGGVGYPKIIPETLSESGRSLALTIVSGGGVGHEIDTKLVEAEAIARRYPFQTKPTSRSAINDGTIAFHDRHISRVADEVAYNGFVDADTAVIEAVAVGPDWLIPSTSIGNSPAFVDAADRLIVEVNRAQPLAIQRVHDVYRRGPPPRREPIPLESPLDRIGEPFIRFDPGKLVAVVETDRPDDPYTFRDPTDVDRTIAENLGDFLSEEMTRNPILADEVNLQFGVGSMGNALMGALEGIDFGDRGVVYYGEVLQDGLLDMMDLEILEGASATSLALSIEGQQKLFDDIDRYAGDIVVRPAAISNSPAVADRFGVIGVNSAIEVDIYGHANATHIGGTRIVNGIGGGGDFGRNSQISILALPSTAADGEISRIVPMVPHVDHTEHDVSIIVTEYGVADLRGLSPRERAGALTAIAHPSFRSELEAYRERAERGGGNIPLDLETAFDWHRAWQK